jgi:hypothetical protein
MGFGGGLFWLPDILVCQLKAAPTVAAHEDNSLGQKGDRP